MNYSEIYAEAVQKASVLADKLNILNEQKSFENVLSLYISKAILEKLEKDNEIS